MVRHDGQPLGDIILSQVVFELMSPETWMVWALRDCRFRDTIKNRDRKAIVGFIRQGIMDSRNFL